MATWPGVQFVVASVEDGDAVRNALKTVEGITGIFHLAGLVEHSRRRPEVMYRVHVAGTLNVLRAALDLVRGGAVFHSAPAPGPPPTRPAWLTRSAASGVAACARTHLGR